MATNQLRRQRLYRDALRYLEELEQFLNLIPPNDHIAHAEWARLYTQAYLCKLRTM